MPSERAPRARHDRKSRAASNPLRPRPPPGQAVTKQSTAVAMMLRTALRTAVVRRARVATSAAFLTAGPAAMEPLKGMDPIIVTEAAAEHVEKMMEKRESPELHLRVAVDEGGCGGFQYVFSFTEESPAESDVEVRRGRASVLVDRGSLDKLMGATIDYETSLMEAGLVIAANPNAESGCGCGSSFALKDDDF